MCLRSTPISVFIKSTILMSSRLRWLLSIGQIETEKKHKIRTLSDRWCSVVSGCVRLLVHQETKSFSRYPHKYGVVRSGKAALRVHRYRASQWWECECRRPRRVCDARREAISRSRTRSNTSEHNRTLEVKKTQKCDKSDCKWVRLGWIIWSRYKSEIKVAFADE